mmetsp:Transcript_37779/g.55372  ORF Transcript_37779/g.55372 Transcript_37779/m.55372 type:complete len:248 (+) Transcript_37779:548-1291(+)
MKDHEKELDDMRSHYNEIVHKNLDRIKSLKEDIVNLKKKQRQDEKMLADLKIKNNNIVKPLGDAKKDLENLSKELDIYKKQREELRDMKARLNLSEEELKDMKWKHEILIQWHQIAEKERNEGREKFRIAIGEAQQKSKFKNMMLEQKMKSMSNIGEQNAAALAEIIARTNLEYDPGALGRPMQQPHVTNYVDEKNKKVHDLENSLRNIKGSRRKLLLDVRKLMKEYEIPVENLNLEHLGLKSSQKI